MIHFNSLAITLYIFITINHYFAHNNYMELKESPVFENLSSSLKPFFLYFLALGQISFFIISKHKLQVQGHKISIFKSDVKNQKYFAEQV
jgi:hypothetical protein